MSASSSGLHQCKRQSCSARAQHVLPPQGRQPRKPPLPRPCRLNAALLPVLPSVFLPAGEFLEVFMDTPLEVCERRDPKGLYKKVRGLLWC